MLLAEELALVAIRPDTGRHGVGHRDALNACLAGLLVAELLMEGMIGQGDDDDRVVVVGRPSGSPTLMAAAVVVEKKGPKIKAVLSHMSRGIEEQTGMGTWDTVVAGLVQAGVVGPATSGLRPRNPLVDTGARDRIVSRLQAAAGEGEIDNRTALVLSITGPANLLQVVAPDRRTRRQARRRIDHALDGSNFAPFGKAVRHLIQEMAAAAAGM